MCKSVTDGSYCGGCNVVKAESEIKKGDSCEIAKNLITGDRNESYGDPFIDYARAAFIATLKTGKVMTPEDLLNVMTSVKDSREAHAHKSDNRIDNIGYQDITNSILEAEEKTNSILAYNMIAHMMMNFLSGGQSAEQVIKFLTSQSPAFAGVDPGSPETVVPATNNGFKCPDCGSTEYTHFYIGAGWRTCTKESCYYMEKYKAEEGRWVDGRSFPQTIAEADCDGNCVDCEGVERCLQSTDTL